MKYPYLRARRLRRNENLRSLFRETTLTVDDLIYPAFVVPGKGIKKEIKTMPGVYHFSIDKLIKDVEETSNLGIKAVILFGIPEKKDELGSGAYDENGIIQRAVKSIKKQIPEILVITDVCLCEYTSHGHCGIVRTTQYEIDNDATLSLLAKTSLSQVESGADIVAPSAMMDGQVKAIRSILDENGFSNIPIMSYSIKYASSFYGPFRVAAESAPQFGDRKSYQMDFSNIREALKEAKLDIEEGADIIMVKPALAYLDVIAKVREICDLPVAAFNVSGEYSMIKSASQKGWIDEKRAVLEILTSTKRAGADIILTYFAKDVARWLKE